MKTKIRSHREGVRGRINPHGNLEAWAGISLHYKTTESENQDTLQKVRETITEIRIRNHAALRILTVML